MQPASHTCRAIGFLQGYMAEFPQAVEATHINMLAQLFLEREQYTECLLALKQAPPSENGWPFPDLMVKQGTCKIKLGDQEAGLQDLLTLSSEAAFEFHDLFVEVCCLCMPAEFEMSEENFR
jgi:hypothetical protein